MQGLPVQFFAKLVGKANAQAAKGRDVINLGQGNPDTPTPPHIVEVMQQASADPRYHKYPPFRGFPFLISSQATGMVEATLTLSDGNGSTPNADKELFITAASGWSEGSDFNSV